MYFQFDKSKWLVKDENMNVVMLTYLVLSFIIPYAYSVYTIKKKTKSLEKYT